MNQRLNYFNTYTQNLAKNNHPETAKKKGPFKKEISFDQALGLATQLGLY